MTMHITIRRRGDGLIEIRRVSPDANSRFAISDFASMKDLIESADVLEVHTKEGKVARYTRPTMPPFGELEGML